LREYVEISRRMVSGDAVTYTGKTVQLRNVQLDFTPVRAHVPMYLGVTGPKALSLAGEIANGVILNGFVSLNYTRKAVEIVRAWEQAHGRRDRHRGLARDLRRCGRRPCARRYPVDDRDLSRTVSDSRP